MRRFGARLLTAGVMCAVISTGLVRAQADRMAVVDGRFVDTLTGEAQPFRGFNYIRLFDDRAWHATFAPELYDPDHAEAALAEMGAHGFNVVRVFIDHEQPDGVVASSASGELSQVYMDNFTDFVSRARDHGLYVIPSLVYLAQSSTYGAIVGSIQPGLDNANAYYLDEGMVAAKAQYAADFIGEIVERDPTLLSSIFAYELENEAHFRDDQRPFNQTSGILNLDLTGDSYDLSSPADKQRLADEGMQAWADTIAAAIRAADPQTMVSANVFTYQAVGRTGPGDTTSDWNDRRFPARPLALAATSLDYLDIHTYPFNDNWLAGDLVTVEWDQTQALASAHGMPLVSGEFGAFHNDYTPTIELAARKMRQHIESLDDAGFVGQMLWTYDTDEQTQLWNGRSDRGQLFQAMVASFRKLDRSTAPVVAEAFGLSGGARVAGGTLDSAKSEFGGVLLAMGDALELVDDGAGEGHLQRTGPGGQALVSPYNPSDAEIMRVSALVASPEGSADWVGVGLTDNVSGNALFWGDGSLWALVRGNGRYEAWFNGTSVSILPDTPGAPDFVPGGFNQLEVIYDNAANRVWVIINGVVVLDGHDMGGATVPITGAGLHLYADGSRADNFEVNILPLWSTVAGDFDGSRVIDTEDISPFVLAMTDPAAFAAAYPGLRAGLIDLNGDGLINTEDINPFITALTGAQPGAVPEPAGLAVVLLAMGICTGRSSRRQAA